MKEDEPTTKDVEITEDVTFRDMMLSDQVLEGLKKCKFVKPSPIQLRAIPIGRCGLDLILQSKSGTGKTLVFCTIILERYDPTIKSPQALIVVPTREIALQVESYLNSIGSCCKGFSATCVIGGRDIVDDRRRISKCRAIVGTPGRLLHLIRNNYVSLRNIQTFVLDEADKLVSDDFYCDINTFLNALNPTRQIIASSATYANGLDRTIVKFMHNPIAVSTSRDTPVLIGVKQFILPVKEFDVPAEVQNSAPSIQDMWRKVSAVEHILRTTPFNQCILFSNSQLRASSFANYLKQKEWTVDLVLGSHDQNLRTATLEKFRQYKSRLLVTSDLMARGVDIANINLVINLDVPSDSSTYLHRIGRCGRFGRRGLAITLANDAAELTKFQNLLGVIGGSKMKVPTYPMDIKGDIWKYVESESDPCVFGISNEDVDPPKTEQKKEVSSEPAQTNGDSVENNNLNLLELAKLLIDTEPAKITPTIDVDEDLFASFQSNDTAPNAVPISDDLFDDFNQFQTNDSSGIAEQEDAVAYTAEILLEETTVIPNHNPLPVTTSENLFEDFDQFQKCTDQQSDEESIDAGNDSTETSSETSDINAPVTHYTAQVTIEHKNQINKDDDRPKRTKIRKNPKKHLSMPSSPPVSDSWSQLYWQQVNAINKYVLNTTYRS